jgi:anti-sigma B factor antagonist
VPAGEHVVWVGRIAIMVLPGEVDLSNADQMRQDLLAVAAQGASLLIADMTATTFCDSAGVTALVRTARKLSEGGTGLRVAASTPAVTRVLAITGVDRLIEVYPSVAAAMANSGIQAAGLDHVARPGPAGQAGPGGRAPQPG